MTKPEDVRTVGMSSTLTSVFAISAANYPENWYVDNEVTSHVTMLADLFADFNEFGDTQTGYYGRWKYCQGSRQRKYTVFNCCKWKTESVLPQRCM